jgi:hypothetical protein
MSALRWFVRLRTPTRAGQPTCNAVSMYTRRSIWIRSRQSGGLMRIHKTRHTATPSSWKGEPQHRITADEIAEERVEMVAIGGCSYEQTAHRCAEFNRAQREIISSSCVDTLPPDRKSKTDLSAACFHGVAARTKAGARRCRPY